MSNEELRALQEALREWRYRCDDRYFTVPGQYTFAMIRHRLVTPEIDLDHIACDMDQFLELWNRD